MNMRFFDRIRSDFLESRITWKVAILFIPIAFISYLFHEFGHWTAGEVLGNDMTLQLNNSSPKSGYFINDSHALWSAIGGPVFTILQALIFLFILLGTKSIYAYSVMFFAGFLRFFSIVFGGLSLQDEGGISAMLDINSYLIAIIVLIILFLIIWIGSRVMRLNIKAIGYFTLLSTLANLIVIGVDELVKQTL